MARRKKYEVVQFNRGDGYFIHGGSLGGMFINSKDDAELICNALNNIEALKFYKTFGQLRQVHMAVEELLKPFDEGTVQDY